MKINTKKKEKALKINPLIKDILNVSQFSPTSLHVFVSESKYSNSDVCKINQAVYEHFSKYSNYQLLVLNQLLKFWSDRTVNHTDRLSTYTFTLPEFKERIKKSAHLSFNEIMEIFEFLCLDTMNISSKTLQIGSNIISSFVAINMGTSIIIETSINLFVIQHILLRHILSSKVFNKILESNNQTLLDSHITLEYLKILNSLNKELNHTISLTPETVRRICYRSYLSFDDLVEAIDKLKVDYKLISNYEVLENEVSITYN